MFGGCGMLEDVDHSFVKCDFFDRFWYLITDWLDFATVTSDNL